MSAPGSSIRAARHLALPQIGESGQQRISEGTALVIGVGGIGCAVATYLASSGVGHLLLNDFDTVDATNLGRQPLYLPSDIGRLKAERAAENLRNLNPEIRIESLVERLDDAALDAAVARADVVLDGSDNFATRFAVSAACVANNTCLISGAAIRFEGQVAIFGPDYKTSACYRCLYSEADESLENCAGNGVLSPVPATIGTLMASEALKYLAGIGVTRNRLTIYDGLAGEWRSLQITQRTTCPH